MKQYKFSLLILILALSFNLGLTSCENTLTEPITEDVTVLTADEIDNLRFMREEEKLARDVYTYLFDQYGLNIFSNIASSEQKHMDAVLAIMDTHQLPDPAPTEYGVFSNISLQALYDKLIRQGDISLVEALTVGGIIEDLDIRDLDNVLMNTSQPSLQMLFESLRCGSGNHLRAFVSQLNLRNEAYTPSYISVDRYEQIIAATHQSCGN